VRKFLRDAFEKRGRILRPLTPVSVGVFKDRPSERKVGEKKDTGK